MSGQNQNKKSAPRPMAIKMMAVLQWIAMTVFSAKRYDAVFWSLVLMCLVLPLQTVALSLLAGGALRVLSSFHRRPRPQGIPLARANLDVLLGRPSKVSEDVPGLHCNNNVTIACLRGTYILAYRQSDIHFSSARTRILVAHSKDLVTWEIRWQYANGCDLREVLLFQMHDRLFLYFFSLEPTHQDWTPLDVFYTRSKDGIVWDEPEKVGHKAEVPWEIKVYGEGVGAVAYKSSYIGDHYGTTGDVQVLFEMSDDALYWRPVPPAAKESPSPVYTGGVSEVSFEFTASGDMVAVGRNEDGDSSGFGTQLFFAKAESLGVWTALRVSVPWRFDSPRMVRTSFDELLLFARYAPHKFDRASDRFNFVVRKAWNLIVYALMPKSAAVYRVSPPSEWSDTGEGAIQLIRQFDGSVGDTGFFSVMRAQHEAEGLDHWVVANYSSINLHSHAPWFLGQMMPSHIFLFKCHALET